jgi:hypothetical protein
MPSPMTKGGVRFLYRHQLVVNTILDMDDVPRALERMAALMVLKLSLPSTTASTCTMSFPRTPVAVVHRLGRILTLALARAG